MGWKFFGSHSWEWPLGLISQWGPGLGTTIGYGPPQPIFDYFFKLIHPLKIGETFQFQGVVFFTTYLLQGVFSFLLPCRWSQKASFRILFGSFLLTAPAFLFCLSNGHWLILAFLYLFYGRNLKIVLPGWIIVFCLAPVIHPYLLVMIFPFFVGHLFLIFKEHLLSLKGLIIYAFSVFTALCTVLYSVGYFLPMGTWKAWGYGELSLNLLGPFNPQNCSYFLPNIPLVSINQFEGYCYLGLGAILLLLLLILTNKKIDFWRESLQPLENKVLFTSSLLLIIFALSNWITIGPYRILYIPYPEFLVNIFSIFRSSGRMVIPGYYLAIGLVLTSTIKRFGDKKALYILTTALLIQFLDIFLAPEYFSPQKYQAKILQSPIWQEIPRHYKHIKVLTDKNHFENWFSISYFAADHGVSVNAGYFARHNPQATTKEYNETKKALLENQLEPTTLYIIPSDEQKDLKLARNNSAGYGLIEGYFVVAPHWFDFKENPVRNLIHHY